MNGGAMYCDDIMQTPDTSESVDTAVGPRLLHRGGTLVEARRRRRRQARQAALRRPAADSSPNSASSSDTDSTQHGPAACEKSVRHLDPTRAETKEEATPLQEENTVKAADGSQDERAAKEPAMRCEECLSSHATGTTLCACVHWRAEIHRLLEENACQTLADADGDRPKTLDEHFFKGNDAKVKYYTGLPSLSLVTAVLARIQPFLSKKSNPSLSDFQTLLLTLVRLRLNMTVDRLARLFDVGPGTVDRTVGATVSALHARLHSLVHWPGREASQRSAPPPFAKAFGSHRVTVIVDCFELPAQLQGQRLKAHCGARKTDPTFSCPKRNRSAKYLVGITPQGMISFVTEGWKGHGEAIIDRYMAENCGILDILWPGDLVLARRGFRIGDDGGSHQGVMMMCGEVRQRPCLDAVWTGETDTHANLWVHVDRVVSTLHNKYTILTGTIPSAMFLPCEGEEDDTDTPFLDKLVVVCCALANLCGSVVVQHKWLLHHYG